MKWRVSDMMYTGGDIESKEFSFGRRGEERQKQPLRERSLEEKSDSTPRSGRFHENRCSICATCFTVWDYAREVCLQDRIQN